MSTDEPIQQIPYTCEECGETTEECVCEDEPFNDHSELY